MCLAGGQHYPAQPSALSNEGSSESWDGDKGHPLITQCHMYSGLYTSQTLEILGILLIICTRAKCANQITHGVVTSHGVHLLWTPLKPQLLLFTARFEIHGNYKSQAVHISMSIFGGANG